MGEEFAVKANGRREKDRDSGGEKWLSVNDGQTIIRQKEGTNLTERGEEDGK